MRVMLLHVALGYLGLLAFGKAQINEPTEVEVDDQQHDLVDEPPPSYEEAAAMIESLLDDVGEKESEISNMRIEIQRIQQENAEEVDYALAERDNEILKLRAKLSEVNETENYLRKLEANLQSQKDKIMQLEEEPKSKELELEESLNTVRLKLETYETILKDLRGVLVVDNDEELLEAVTELSLNASRMAPVDINNDSLDSDGRTEGNKEVIDGNREDLEDDLRRAQEELANMMEEASLVQNKWKGFVVNVTDLVSELAACRTGEKEMDRAVHGDEEEILTVLKKLSEEVNTCQVEEQKEKESKMDHEDGEEKNFQLDNMKSELESCRSECKAEIAELSKRLLPKEEDKNEDEVLAEHQDSTLLQQAESLLYGLKNLEGELEGLQEGKESSSQNEARENVAQIVKQLSNALIIGRELADLNGSFPDFQLVAYVQDMTEESSSSSSGEDEDVVYDVEPKEEKEEEIEREIQEEHVVEVEVDSQGHTTSQPNESLLSRIGELEEELVKCREKYELQSILDHRNTSPPFDENILVGSTDPIPEDEEEELHKPEKQTYTSSTPDYRGLSTFIGDTLTIGSSLASTGMKTTTCGVISVFL